VLHFTRHLESEFDGLVPAGGAIVPQIRSVCVNNIRGEPGIDFL
jgi:hypothetical protein